MKKIPIILTLSLVLVFGLALQASAFNVTYTGPDTNYVITSVNTNSHQVTEDYNAKDLILFPSHDGYAVVDLGFTPALDGTFRKNLIFDNKDAGKKNFEITWEIKNTTPFTWSDYHFFLLDGDAVFTKAQSADFKDATFTLLTATFNAVGPGSKLIAPNDTLHLNFDLDLTNLPAAGQTIHGLQLATAVPIPAALPLFGSGLLGLGLLGWRRK